MQAITMHTCMAYNTGTCGHHKTFVGGAGAYISSFDIVVSAVIARLQYFLNSTS
jgi:hypothetical protein